MSSELIVQIVATALVPLIIAIIQTYRVKAVKADNKITAAALGAAVVGIEAMADAATKQAVKVAADNVGAGDKMNEVLDEKGFRKAKKADGWHSTLVK